MVRETYVKPEFDFQEVALFETVAAKCWGTSQVWIDANRDGVTTDGLDIQISTSGGCQGSWSANAMTDAISELNGILRDFNESEQDYEILKGHNYALYEWAVENNIESISEITASPTSNWANTQATSGGGIIIIGSN